jgi:PAS domain S-box-containing protein
MEFVRPKDDATRQAELLRLVTDAMPALISYVDADGRYQFNNKGYEEWFGCRREELRGKHLREVLGEAAFERLRPHVEAVLAGKRRQFESEIPYKDGGPRHIHADYVPDRRSDGTIAGFFALVTDITDRKRSEEALRASEEALGASEERFRTMANTTPAIVWTADAAGNITYHNPRWLAYTGLTAEQNRDWPRLVLHPDDYERCITAWQQAVAEGAKGAEYEIEVRNRRHDGVYRWFLTRATPIRDEQGCVLEWYGSSTDIDALKTAQQELRASEARLRESQRTLSELVERAPFGIYIVDAQFRLAHVNAGSQQGAFRNVRPLIGRDFSEAMHIIWPPAVAAEVVAIFRRTLETGEPYRSPGFNQPRHDIGVVESYEWELHRITLANGGFGVVCYYYDSTRLREAEEALRASEAELREADRRKDEFLATLAHELRNPLAPIRNSLNILRLSARDAAAQEKVVDMMQRQVNHMVRLVDDLLEVSRITRGKIELRKEIVELAAVVRGAVETAGPVIEAAGHRLTLALPSEPVLLDADPVRLAQVLANLLHNAAKYTEEGGQITLGASRDGDRATLSVRDTGTGIPAEMLPRVFDLFTQIDRTLGRAQGGLGIGLALVKSLVQLHGGAVEVRSDGPGQGSEFIVTLPLAGADAAGRTGKKPAAEAALVLARQPILVVDDNRDAADSLAMMLRYLGADVRTAYNGPAALEAVRVHRPAVIFLDIGMPGMDGYAVAAEVRRQPQFQDVTLIALTGWGQEADKRRSEEAGFNHHMVKPPDPQAIEALLGSIARS